MSELSILIKDCDVTIYADGEPKPRFDGAVSVYFRAPDAAREKAEDRGAPAPRYVLLDEHGEPLPAGATDHAAVLVPAANLIVHPHSLGEGNDNYDAAVKRCAEFRGLGKEDWRLASRADWEHILDLTRRDPAVDAAIFPGIKPRWHWALTLPEMSAWASGDAWFVNAYHGSVGASSRLSTGFALAVRGAGQ